MNQGDMHSNTQKSSFQDKSRDRQFHKLFKVFKYSSRTYPTSYKTGKCLLGCGAVKLRKCLANTSQIEARQVIIGSELQNFETLDFPLETKRKIKTAHASREVLRTSITSR